MNPDTVSKTIAVLATDGFQTDELLETSLCLRAAGATVKIVSLQAGRIRGWRGRQWDAEVEVDVALDTARAEDFDALFLPGGVMNPDTLRQDERAVAFTRAFFAAGKPVGAICHGPWLLVEADVVSGRRVTSTKSIETDLANAGAKWEDAPVVCDQGLVTSRTSADLDDFCAKFVEQVTEGVHEGQHA